MSRNKKESYYCNVCKLPYDSVAQYEEHLWSMLHHRVLENNGQKENHFCTLCLETFPTLTDYSVHLISAKHKDAHSMWQRAQSTGRINKAPRSFWDEHTGTSGRGISTSDYKSYSSHRYWHKSQYGKKTVYRQRPYHVNAPRRNVTPYLYETGFLGRARSGNNSNRSDRYRDGGRSYPGHDAVSTETEQTRTVRIIEKHTENRPYNHLCGRPSIELSLNGKSRLNSLNGGASNFEHLNMDVQNQRTGHYDTEGNQSIRSHAQRHNSTDCFSEDITISQMKSVNGGLCFSSELQHPASFVTGKEPMQRGNSLHSDQRWQESMDSEEKGKHDSRYMTTKESAAGHSSFIVHVEVNKGCNDCSSHSRHENGMEVGSAVVQAVLPRVGAGLESEKRDFTESRKQATKFEKEIQCGVHKMGEGNNSFGIDCSVERVELPRTSCANIAKEYDVGATKSSKSTIVPKMNDNVAGQSHTSEAGRMEMMTHVEMSVDENSIPSGRLELLSKTRGQTENHHSYGSEMSTSDSFSVKDSEPCEFQHNHSNDLSVSFVTKSNATDSEQLHDTYSDTNSCTSLKQSVESPENEGKISDVKETPAGVTTQNSQMTSASTSASSKTTPSSSVPNEETPPASNTISSEPLEETLAADMALDGVTSATSPSGAIPSSSVAHSFIAPKVPPASCTIQSGPPNKTPAMGMTLIGPVRASSLIDAVPSTSALNDRDPPSSCTVSSGPPIMTSGADSSQNGNGRPTYTSPSVGTMSSSSASNNKVELDLRSIASELSNKPSSSRAFSPQVKLPDLIQKLLKKQSSKPNLNSARSSHPRENSGVAVGDLKRVLLGLFESPVPQHHRKLQEEQLKKLFAKVGCSSDRFKKFGVHLEMADTEDDEMIKLLEKLTEEDLELLAQNESHDILHELLSLYELPGEKPPSDQAQQAVTISSVASSSITASSLISSSTMTSSPAPCTVSSSQLTQQCAEPITSGKPEEVALHEHKEELLVSSESEDDDEEIPPQPTEIDQAVFGQVFQLSLEENQLRQLLKSTRKELRTLESKIREYTEKANALKVKKLETKKKIKSVRKNRLKLTTDHVKQSSQGVSQIASGQDSASKPSSQKNHSSPLPPQGPKPKGTVSVTAPKDSSHPNRPADVLVPQLPVIKPGSQHSLQGTSMGQSFPPQHPGINSPLPVLSSSTPSTSGLNVFESSPLHGVGPNYGVGQIFPPEAMGISIQKISEEEVMKLVQMQGVTQNVSPGESGMDANSSDILQQISAEGMNPKKPGKKHQESSINSQQGLSGPDRTSQAVCFVSHGVPHSSSQILPLQHQDYRSQSQLTMSQQQKQHVSEQRLNNDTNSELFDQVIANTELEKRCSGNSVPHRSSESDSQFPPYPVGIIKINNKQQSSVDAPLEKGNNSQKQMKALSGSNMKETQDKNLMTVIVKKEPEDEYPTADQHSSSMQMLSGHSESMSSCSGVTKVEPEDSPEDSSGWLEVHTNHDYRLRPRKIPSKSKNLTLAEDSAGPKESSEDVNPTGAKRLCTSVSSNIDSIRQLREVSVGRKDVPFKAGVGRQKESEKNSQPSTSKRSLTSAASKKGNPSLALSSMKDEAKKGKASTVDKNSTNSIEELKELKRKLKLEKKVRIAQKRKARLSRRLEEYRDLGLSQKFMEIAENRSTAKLQDRRDLNAEIRRLKQVREDERQETLKKLGETKPSDEKSPVDASSGSCDTTNLNSLQLNCKGVSWREHRQRSKAALKAARKAKRVAQLRSIGIPEDLLDIVKKGGSATKAEAAQLNKEMSKTYAKQLQTLKKNKKKVKTNILQNQIKQNSIVGNQRDETSTTLALDDPSNSGVVTRSKLLSCDLTNTVSENVAEGPPRESPSRSTGKRHLQRELCLEKAILGIHGFFDKLYAYSPDGSTRSYSLPDLKQERIYSGHQKRITGLHMFTDSTKERTVLFSTSQDRKLLCFNLETHQFFRKHTVKHPVTCMVGTGETIFLGLANGRVELFHARKLISYESYVCHNKGIMCLAIAFISGNQFFVSGASDGSLAIHSVTSGTLYGALKGHQSSVLCAQVAGSYVLSGATDGCLLQHHIVTKEVIKEYTCHKAAITSILVKGNIFYTACLDDMVRVFNVKRQQITAHITVDKVLSLCLYKQKIYVGTVDGSVILLPNIPSGKTASSSKQSSSR